MNSVDRKNDLLKKLHSKELTMDQFLMACARWGMETGCFIELEVREYPTAPRAWKEYIEMPLDRRSKISDEFFMRLDIREYLQDRGKIYAQNYADYCWLKDMKKCFPDTEENLAIHMKLDVKIEELYQWIYNINPMVERVVEAFSGKVTRGGAQ